MPASRDHGVRLRHILEAIDGIRATLDDVDYNRFASDWTIRSAVERGLEIISEASRHLPEEMKAAEVDVPWREIAGIGNILRHVYDKVSDEVVWDAATQHLDTLGEAVRRMLAAKA